MDPIELEEKQREKRLEILIQNIEKGELANLEEAKELAEIYGKKKELKNAIEEGKKSKFKYLLNRIKEGKASESEKNTAKELAEKYNEIKKFDEAIMIGKQKIRKEKQADIRKFKRIIHKIKQTDFTDLERIKYLAEKYGKQEELRNSIAEGLEKLKKPLNSCGYGYFYGLCDIKRLKLLSESIKNLNKKQKKDSTWGLPFKDIKPFTKYCGDISNGYRVVEFLNKVCKKEDIFLRFRYLPEKREIIFALWDWRSNTQIFFFKDSNET